MIDERKRLEGCKFSLINQIHNMKRDISEKSEILKDMENRLENVNREMRELELISASSSQTKGCGKDFEEENKTCGSDRNMYIHGLKWFCSDCKSCAKEEGQ